MITGQILEENGVLNLSCYPGSLPIGSVACEGGINGGKFQRTEWATPITKDNMTISGFQYDPAPGTTPPATDAFKVVLVSEGQRLGSYKRVVIPNDWGIAELIAACCAGCDPIDDVTVPTPDIPLFQACIAPAVTCPPCVYNDILDVPAFTGGNNTYTATPVGTDAAGAAITFSPTSVTGTSLALLATAAQAAWATELGSGTFTANGTILTVTGTNIGSLNLHIVASTV